MAQGIVDRTAPPGIVGTAAGFLACAAARTLNTFLADPLPDNRVARYLRNSHGCGLWKLEDLSYGEFIAYGTGLGTVVGLVVWLAGSSI
jgi:hypothetical protein